MADDDQAARRKRERTPPDLHALIDAHGSYGAITPEAWAQYDAEMATYLRRMRTGYFYLEDHDDRRRRRA